MKYNVIVIKNIWDSMANPITQNMLHPLLSVKKSGYESRHTADMIPLGLEDFFGEHVMICKKIDSINRPVCIFKVITSTDVERYSMLHPFIQTLEKSAEKEYIQRVQKHIDQLHKTGHITSYSGGFTLDREILEINETEVIKEIYCALHTLLHESRNIHTMYGFSVPRLKTDKLFEKWGIEKLDLGDGIKKFNLKGYGDVESVPMHAEVSKLSFYSKQMAKKYRPLWEARLDTSREVIIEAA